MAVQITDPIEALGLPTRVVNPFREGRAPTGIDHHRVQIRTIADLVALTKEEFLGYRNVGPWVWTQVSQALAAHGLPAIGDHRIPEVQAARARREAAVNGPRGEKADTPVALHLVQDVAPGSLGDDEEEAKLLMVRLTAELALIELRRDDILDQIRRQSLKDQGRWRLRSD